jgi:Leucine-rich repeat (LRR) protein
MNYLIPSFLSIPEFQRFWPVQQLIAKYPIICALGAIGMIATVTAYCNATQNVPAPLVHVEPTAQLIAKAQDLIAFYNALPADLNKPPIQGESVITQAVFIKHWMENEGRDAIIRCRELDLRDKQITTLPPEIGLFKALRELNLSHNQLAALPPEIGRLQALTRLYLSHNQLAALPPEIGRFQALISLDLSHNQLEALPPEIGRLQALTRLYLSQNQLAALPQEIGGLQALISLDLSHNQLAALPQEIGRLQALRGLHLSQNQLEALPQEIGGLQALMSLDLSYNELAVLPPEIGGLQALMSLDLSHNQLAALPQEIGRLQALTSLSLSYNQLVDFPDSILNLSGDCFVNVEHNRFIPGFVQPFNQRLSVHRFTHPLQGPWVAFSIFENVNRVQTRTLGEMLLVWSGRFEAAFPNNEANAELWQSRTTDFSSLLSLEDPYDRYLNEFLAKIEGIQDFGPLSTPEMQKNVILRAERMIQLACTNPVFKKKMIDILATGGSSCGDRATVLFNEIEIEWQFHHKLLTKEEFIALAKRAALYDLVEAYAKKFAQDNRLGDEVETILDFHLRLREKLDLPISTQTMLYRGMSGLPQYDDQVIDEAHAVMLSYMQPGNETLLMHSKHWKERVKSQNQLTALAIQEKYTDMLSLAEEFYQLSTEEDRTQWLAKNSSAELHAILSHAEQGKNYHATSEAIGNALQTALDSLSDNDRKDPA